AQNRPHLLRHGARTLPHPAPQPHVRMYKSVRLVPLSKRGTVAPTAASARPESRRASAAATSIPRAAHLPSVPPSTTAPAASVGPSRPSLPSATNLRFPDASGATIDSARCCARPPTPPPPFTFT